MVSNDPLMFADPDRHAPIAIGGESVTAVVLETTMSFYVFGFRNAEPVWSVIYDTQEHPEHVKVSGVYPEEWKAIGERLVTQADACDPEPLGEDLLADAPIDLFAAMTGFRHDRPHQAFERNARVLVAR